MLGMGLVSSMGMGRTGMYLVEDLQLVKCYEMSLSLGAMLKKYERCSI